MLYPCWRDFLVNIAWIVMHCLDNLDDCAVGCATGQRLLPSEWRWDLWQCRPEERPKPGDPFPGPAEMLSRLRAIRQAAMAALEGIDEGALLERVGDHPRKPLRSDWYVRTICHTNSHVRQVWLLRGALGLGGGPWPQPPCSHERLKPSLQRGDPATPCDA